MVGWAAFVGSDTCMKWLTSFYGPAQLIWTVNIIGLALTIIWTLVQFGPNGFKSARWQFHALRGLCIVGSSYCVVNALARIQLADFYGIVFISPIIMMLLSHFFLGEKVGWHRMAAAVVGFMGVLVLAGPQFAHIGAGVMFAACGALCSSVNGIVTRKIGREPHTPLFALYPFLFNTLAWSAFVPGFDVYDPAHFPLFAVVPPFILLGFICYSIAFSRAPEISVIAPFHYTQILWGTLLGFLLFKDIPTWSTLLGAAIIIGAGLYIIWREHYRHKQRAI